MNKYLNKLTFRMLGFHKSRRRIIMNEGWLDMSVIRDNYPQRLRQLHIVHAPATVHALIALFRGLMNDKLKDRFIVHSSVDSLAKHLPQSTLPVEYGGSAESSEVLAQLWTAELLTRRDKLRAACAPLSAPPQPLHQRDLHGCQGTFRALSVD